MHKGLTPRIRRASLIRFALGVVGGAGRGAGESAFEGVVGYEEEGCARGGTDDGGAHASVDAGEAAGGGEAGGGLEAGF